MATQTQTTDPVDTTLEGSTIVKVIPPASTTATVSEGNSQPKKIVDNVQTPWSTYLNSLNAKYQDRIRKAAQAPNYNLTMRNEDGHEEKQVFTRMKLLQYQFDELEDLRAEATDFTNKDQPKEAAKATSAMYTKAANYLLWNAKEERPMTEYEYKHCFFPEIRPALDASMLLGLVSDPF